MAASYSKKKCRQYSLEYLKLGFIASLTNETRPMCLLCEKTFSNDAMKPAKMKDHIKRLHPDTIDKDLDFFKELKEKYTYRSVIKPFMKAPDNYQGLTAFCKNSESGNKQGLTTALYNIAECDNNQELTASYNSADADNKQGLTAFYNIAEAGNKQGLTASYNISLNIAKKGKPYTIAEDIVIPAIKEVIETIMKKDSGPVLKFLPLSANTVKRRIGKMAEDVEKTVLSELKNSKFSIQLEESTFDSFSILLAYVRYYSKTKHQIIDEFLFAKYLESDETGLTIFQRLEEYLNKYDIPFTNITALGTDGSPAMVGFAAFLKEKVQSVRTNHCLLNLVSKTLSDELHDTLRVYIKCINQIRAHPLESLLFTKLWEKNNEDSNKLLFHTEIRWLTKGASLQRFVEMFDSTLEFLTDVNLFLRDELKRNKNHIFYLADLLSKFNDVQTRLQGKDVTIIQVRTILLGLQAKLGLFKASLLRKDFRYFSNLRHLEVKDEDLKIYTKHLQNLSDDFKLRFADFENMHIPDWVITPFSADIENVKCNLLDELIELSVDLEANALFKNRTLSYFWTNINIVEKYPKLTEVVLPFLIAFPSSYLVEAGFNYINSILTQQRNKLDIEFRGDLRLRLTNFEPNIANLVKGHEAHPSH